MSGNTIQKGMQDFVIKQALDYLEKIQRIILQS